MTQDHALAFIAFSVAAAGTPGPSNTLLTATGASVGVVRGLPALLGVAAGMAALMFTVVFGVGSAVVQSALILAAARWAGAAFLVWLAWKIATAPVARESAPIALDSASPATDSGSGDSAAAPRPVGFLSAALFQWINPKSWLACTSAAAAFVDPNVESIPHEAVTLALLFAAVALPCCLIWLAFGAVVHRLLRSAQAQRTFNLAMAALLLVSVVLLLLP